jgi:hypothetical protein
MVTNSPILSRLWSQKEECFRVAATYDHTLFLSLKYSMEPNLFFSTDFHRIIFGLPVGNVTSISRTTLEYFMTIVHNMFYPFPFFSLPKINEVQAEWDNGLR